MLGEGNIFFEEEKEEKENIWRGRVYFVVGEQKNRKEKGGKSLEKEKETDIWRRKLYFLVEEKKTEKEKEEIIWRRKLIVTPKVGK